MEEIYERISDPKETMWLCDLKEPSKIKNCFAGKNVLFTGCTGFLGKCTVEKLLRECSGMNKLYLLVRRKKEISIEERMKKFFNHILFQTLWKMRPSFMEQVVTIEGDLMLPDLGITPEDRRLIIETTDIIIHNAANVNFMTRASIVLQSNVLGTKRMLDLACECHHLKTFLYISTIYCQAPDVVEEKFYPAPGDLKTVYDMIKADSETEQGLSQETIATVCGKNVNIYMFSKAIAETLVQDYAKRVNFTCGVFRMSIVLATYQEPMKSWCGNMNGPMIAFVYTALGIFHSWYLPNIVVFDVIPADTTANAMIAVIWDLIEDKKDSKEGHVYNYGSSMVNPVTMLDIYEKASKDGANHPSSKTMNYCFAFTWRSKFFHTLSHLLFHVFPAFLADLYRLYHSKKPKFLPLVWKLHLNNDWIEYFSNTQWNVDVTQMSKIWDRMNLTDRKLFYSDLRTLDWDDYFFLYWRGLRTYLLKDPMDTVPQARRRYFVLSAGFFLFCSLVLLFLLRYLMIPIVRYVFGI